MRHHLQKSAVRHIAGFTPDLSEYMKLNGYALVDSNPEIGLLTFRKGNVAVLFYKDKIERRIISADKSEAWRVMKAFKGWDGKNIFNLMLALHLLDVVNLSDVARAARQINPGMVEELITKLQFS